MSRPNSRKGRIERILTDFAATATQPHPGWNDLESAPFFCQAVTRLSRLCTEEKHAAYAEVLTAIMEDEEDEGQEFT